MVIVGTPADAFLSHIPLYKTPHDLQLIVAGSIVPETTASEPLPSSFSDAPWTFLPDRFSLDALSTGTLRPAELRGVLFHGNFEAGGQALSTRVRFVVSRIVHQHFLGAERPLQALTYLVFGTPERTFAAHRVSVSPSFDEVLRVELSGDVPTPAELGSGVEITLDAKDALSSRLGLAGAPESAHAGTRTFAVKPAIVLSCLEGPEFGPPCHAR